MWCACAPASTASSSSARAPTRSRQRCARELQQLFASARRERRAHDAAPARSALVKGYRLLLSPWLGSVLPLRADLLGLCASRRWNATARPPAATSRWPHRALPALVRRAATIRCRSTRRRGCSPRCSPLPLPDKKSLHERYSPHHPVGDLWFLAGAAVGPMAGPQRQQATFLPSAKAAGRRPPASAPARRRRRCHGCRRAGGAVPHRRRRPRRRRGAGRRLPRGRGGQRAARTRRRSAPTCSSSTFDTEGGSLVRTEFLQAIGDPAEQDQARSCCWTRAPPRVYVAQTGLITAAAASLPNHKTPMTASAGARELKDGAERAGRALRVAPTSAASSWSRPTRFKRGAYAIGGAATRSSTPATTPRRRRSCTCSWCATATSRRASRRSTPPSPARPSTPRPRSSRRSTSTTSTKNKAELRQGSRPTARSRWCSTTSPVGLAARRAGSGISARALRAQGRQQPATRSA